MSSVENLYKSSEYQADLQSSVSIDLKPCRICGRTFIPDSLERHEKVCEKSKKIIRRNVFNSFSQRAKDIAVSPIAPEGKGDEKKKLRQCKEEIEKVSKVAKCEKNPQSDVLNNGSSLQKSLPGYYQCPSCGRSFNQKAADRHITWCVEQQTRLPKTPPNSEALERLKARVKYRAPLPKKRTNQESSIRLVKSAESVRELSVLRTHSSPPNPARDVKSLNRMSNIKSCPMVTRKVSGLDTNMNPSPLLPKKIEKNVSCPNIDACSLTRNSSPLVSSNPATEVQNKKAVKFKEIFPVYKKDRNKNLDMLAALRLKLSELKTSDDFLDDCFASNNNEPCESFLPNYNFLNSPQTKYVDSWNSDGEMQGSTSSSSDGSLPSLSRTGSSEQRMPRFCYNCGTKYPIVSAKFCCECGARRFVFGSNDQMYAV